MRILSRRVAGYCFLSRFMPWPFHGMYHNGIWHMVCAVRACVSVLIWLSFGDASKVFKLLITSQVN